MAPKLYVDIEKKNIEIYKPKKVMKMAGQIERISARLRPSVKETIQKAAGITGATLNQFLVHSAFEKAQAVIEHERVINLTLRDAQTFFNSVVNPPEPSPELLDAMKAYRKEFPDAENRGFKSKSR